MARPAVRSRDSTITTGARPKSSPQLLSRLAWLTALALGAGHTLPGLVHAQTVREVRLGPATGELEDGFTSISAVRELSDGRLLVADRSEIRVAVADWRTGRITTVGREGKGPGEYAAIAKLHPLRADSTLVEDPWLGRWLLLDADRIVDAFPYGQRRGRTIPFVWGGDRSGNVLAVEWYSFGQSPGEPKMELSAFAESLLVALESRATGRRDTIARLKGGFLGNRELRKPVVPGGPPIRWVIGNPLGVEEQALLFPDGWIAIARASPYRVEWVSPDGQRRAGPPLPFERVPVDERQKRAAIAWRFKPGAGFTPDEMPPWPATLPPFTNEALVATHDGRLAIRRMSDARIDATRYDVVDRAGRLTARIILGRNERIAGFGRQSVYVIEKDEHDLEWIRRHRWP